MKYVDPSGYTSENVIIITDADEIAAFWAMLTSNSNFADDYSIDALWNSLKQLGYGSSGGNFAMASNGTGFWYDSPLGYPVGFNYKIDDNYYGIQGAGIKSFFVAWGDVATNGKGLNDSYSNAFTYLGWANSLLESLASQTAYDLENARYAVKGQNLAKQAKFMSKLSAKLSVAGGFIAIADNAYQAYQAYNNGQYIVAGLQAFQAYHYAVGTGMLFVPITAPFGAAVLTVHSAIDIGEYLYINR